MSHAFFKTYSLFDIVMLVISIIYILLPMEAISEYLFPLDNIEEVLPIYNILSLLLMRKGH
jgi:hypothetical protein